MRYAPGFIIKGRVVSKLAMAAMLAALCVLPQSVSAQVAEEGAAPEPTLEEPAPAAESSGEEGGLSPRLHERTRKNWDPSAYEIQYTPRPKEPSHTSRARKPRNPALAPGIALGVSLVSLGGGLAMVTVGVSQRICISFVEPCYTPSSSAVLIGTGAALTLGGLVGTIVSSVALRDVERRRSKAPNHRAARWVKWDSETSRLVF